MTHEVVAQNSKNLAEKYTKEGNFGRAFSHYLVAFNLKPELKTQFRDEFSTVLCKWGRQLDEKKRFEDLFKCYEQAVEVFPNDVVILNNLGAHLLRCGLVKESAYYFRMCLKLNPYFLRAGRNLENALNLAVERWHFRMLNDQHRNEAFREAIIKKIKQGFDRVLDVGTGTGILSLFCSEGQAKQIYACDSSPIMTEIAEQVFRSNNIENVKLINKHSSELHIPEKVSLLVTETFDAGVFGEDILQTLSHAWKHLLLRPEQGGVVIPFGARIFATGIQFDPVANDPKQMLFNFENQPPLQCCDNYDCYDLSRARFKSLTECVKVLEINFNDPNAVDEVPGGWEEDFVLRCETSGRVDCFAVWFDLKLDEDIVLSTNPNSKSCAWDQAVFPLPRSVYVEKEQKIKLKVGFKSKLYIQMCSFEGEKLSESLIKTLNNHNLTNILNKVVHSITHTFDESVCVLDCYPFPVFGLGYLIKRKNSNDVLTCFVPTENDRRFVNATAKKHGVVVDVLVGEFDFECLKHKKFDLIVVDLVETNGEVKDGVLLHFNELKSLLNPNGVILPEDVICYAQFAYSDWLIKASKVTNNTVTCGYNIADYINMYQVQHFIDFDYKSIDAITASESFELFSLFNDFESIKEMKVDIKTKFCALVYWFNIRFIKGCEISTYDSDSYHQSAILLTGTEVPGEIRFNVIRNDGLFFIELL